MSCCCLVVQDDFFRDAWIGRKKMDPFRRRLQMREKWKQLRFTLESRRSRDGIRWKRKKVKSSVVGSVFTLATHQSPELPPNWSTTPSLIALIAAPSVRVEAYLLYVVNGFATPITVISVHKCTLQAWKHVKMCALGHVLQRPFELLKRVSKLLVETSRLFGVDEKSLNFHPKISRWEWIAQYFQFLVLCVFFLSRDASLLWEAIHWVNVCCIERLGGDHFGRSIGLSKSRILPWPWLSFHFFDLPKMEFVHEYFIVMYPTQSLSLC